MTGTRLSNARLGTLEVALAAAFVLLPRPLAAVLSGRGYGDEQQLTERVSTAFVDYWRAGRRTLTLELSQLVDYWRWFHVVKAAAAIGLLVVLVVLAIRLWTAYVRTEPHAHAWSSAIGGVLVTVLSLAAFALALANVQGTLAPFSSLMSLLPVRSPSDQLAAVIALVKDELAHYPSGSSAALRRMVSDFAHYHVVVAVISWSVAVVLTVLAMGSWRRFARTAKTARHARRLFAALGVASLIMAALIAVLALGNTTAAVDSPEAVLNFYRGTY